METLTTAAVGAWLADYAAVVHAQASYLTELDAAIGDADHGSNMDRGMQAVAALDAGGLDSPAAYLKTVGMTLVSTVGGASGPLYGTFFLRFAPGIAGAEGSAVTECGAGLRAGLAGVVDRGKAGAGDKTMVDALGPGVTAYERAVAAGGDLRAALAAAAAGARIGRDATIPLVARKGRASYLGERSVGHLDPGAVSMTMLLESAARTLGA